jgi:hypothetical protein
LEALAAAGQLEAELCLSTFHSEASIHGVDAEKIPCARKT